MYVSDLSDAIWFSVKNFNKIPIILNIGTGKDYSVLDYYKVSKIIYPEAKFILVKKNLQA